MARKEGRTGQVSRKGGEAGGKEREREREAVTGKKGKKKKAR